MNIQSRARGCRIGGAYGDMQGAAVEFHRYHEIISEWGPKGICIPNPSFGFSHPVVTDDTQMENATARGVVRAGPGADDEAVLASVYDEYRAWLETQRNPRESRAPGTTCLAALRSGVRGPLHRPINNSMGCGGIMRVHSVGIAWAYDPQRALTLGMKVAALTHGNPNGFVPAGVFACMIAYLASGHSFFDAFERTMDTLRIVDSYLVEETCNSISTAFTAPTKGIRGLTIDTLVGQRAVSPGGWLGHDCLAIALYAVRCALEDPLEVVTIAVNHSGDSDSTGCVAGAIVGALHGPAAFEESMERHGFEVEGGEEIVQLADQLCSLSASYAS